MADAGVKLVPIDLLIVQPTPFCNSDCSYCYLPNRADKRRMSTETLDALARFLRDVPLAEKTLTAVWHAGEPLAVPPAFYEDAFARFKAAGLPLSHNIQTNATLINDAWCELFKRWDVQLGVSLDGPRELHDSHRVDRAERGTFDAAMRGVAKLQEHGLGFAVLSVATEKTFMAADAYWDFIESLGPASVGFNVEEAEGTHKRSGTTRPSRLPAYRRFLNRIAERRRSIPGIRIRELDDTRSHLSAPDGIVLQRSDNRPGSILNVDVEGDYTTFSPELLATSHPRYGTFKWGNVRTDPWKSMAKHPGFLRAHRDIASGVERCRRTCDYFSLCGGGCPSNKLAELGTFDSSETDYCRFHMQAVADVVLERAEDELAQPPRGGPDLYVLGSGVSFPSQLTMETYDALKECAVICTNLREEELEALPRELRSKCVSLWPLYQDGRKRSRNYCDVTRRVLELAEKRRPAAWLTPGHPRVFDSVSTALLSAAQARGWTATVLPGISCFDTLLADVGYDPAGGLAFYEATDLVAHGIPVVPSAATVLLQPSAFFSDKADLTLRGCGRDLAPLRNHLLKYLPGGHRCVFVRSAAGPNGAPFLRWTRLADLASVPYNEYAGGTLFIPPAEEKTKRKAAPGTAEACSPA